jgi:hypothetical protein
MFRERLPGGTGKTEQPPTRMGAKGDEPVRRWLGTRAGRENDRAAGGPDAFRGKWRGDTASAVLQRVHDQRERYA